eukprot:gnl/TRDRNA2_/TRDRNA2_81371_c0_seq2.p1 gnl/TRDRNA2_/TRDRNA2_81371_c0~~gnl/TRDRNA2_/TRDRNA2_81371_c0_seq2.p1  ORF type:complete len:501 (+),score=77.03 gnl/TRDRNA2_/TRDRNA2_81371_c0_seq2:43-1503(+)
MRDSRHIVLLVAGPKNAGKTSLIRCFADGRCPEKPPSTIGLDAEAARVRIEPGSKHVSRELATVLPEKGLDLEIWEIGGRERHHRSCPRDRLADGILLCYDINDRASFQSAAHILLQHRMDWHMVHMRSATLSQKETPCSLAAVLCGTKFDEQPAQNIPAVKSPEVQDFVQAHQVFRSVTTSARVGQGVKEAFQALIVAVLETRRQASGSTFMAAAAGGAASPCLIMAPESWSLRERERPGTSPGTMTSPRGVRPCEPSRHGTAPALVEVFDQNGIVFGVRPLEKCLALGLKHRAVHVWLCIPRTGGLLLRKYAPDFPKHPTRWGPTAHGEVHCYGSEGDSRLHGEFHASEISAQAAARCLKEQLGVSEMSGAVGKLEHWFSSDARDGTCHELIDVYVAPIEGAGLPPLRLPAMEEAEWVFFADVFGEDAVLAGTICHMEDEYRQSMIHRTSMRMVAEDAQNAFPDNFPAHQRNRVVRPGSMRGAR